VLHYGIKMDEIQCSPPARRYDDQELRFLFVGRLAEKKDPITLLRSFASARKSLLPVNSVLTMAGDGPLRATVEKEIAALGLADHVRLLGRRTHHEVIELYQSAHIYVQHSVIAPNGDEEGLPVSITEALAAGLPVVSTRHSGIPEAVIDGVTGVLVDEKDIQGMADAMVDLARNPDRWDQFGRAGRALLEEEFSVPLVQEKLRSVLGVKG
jgi:glycosyltransferase involved in cell wall biosynthesis